MANELTTVKDNAFALTEQADIGTEDMAGLEDDIRLPKIKVPAGGGLNFEIVTDDPDNPDTMKTINAVVLHKQALRMYYKDKYTGGNEQPDCFSPDGKHGADAEGLAHNCKECPYAEWGSAEDGAGQACKSKQRLFLLLEGNLLPYVLDVPTGSVKAVADYVVSLVTKARKLAKVVTTVSLVKAENKSGIKYSQVKLTFNRLLSVEELETVAPMVDVAKGFSAHRRVSDNTFDDERDRVRADEKDNLPF